MKGLVVKNTGSWYQVYTETEETIDCKIKGNFRMQEIRSTNPVAVGDRVDIEKNKEGTAFITHIEDRKNYIIRRSSNLSKQSHILAANLDQAVLIITIKEPETSTVFVDRFLCVCEAYRIPAVILVNKIDLYDENDIEYMNQLMYLYKSIGYPCLGISASDNTGINDVMDVLKGKISLFSGNSGVGKSTLINKIVPNANLKTNTISSYHKKGMHTTTFSEMIRLEEGGYIIDTPGIKGLGTVDMDKYEISHYFKELFVTSKQCKYANCLHLQEPGCAVLKAVDASQISISRYNSYLSIMDDMTDGKYR